MTKRVREAERELMRALRRLYRYDAGDYRWDCDRRMAQLRVIGAADAWYFAQRKTARKKPLRRNGHR